MSEIIDNIAIEVEKFNQSIRVTLNAKNINNTKEASDSLTVVKGNDFVESQGVFYLEFLDTGRGPGKPPPFRKILEWAMQKTGQPANEVWALAVYVRNKIAELGTKIFQNNANGIELDKKIEELQENIDNSIGNTVNLMIEKKLDKFKKIYEMSLS